MLPHFLKSHVPTQIHFLAFVFYALEIIRWFSCLLGLYFFTTLPENLSYRVKLDNNLNLGANAVTNINMHTVHVADTTNVDTFTKFFIFLLIFVLVSNVSNTIIYFTFIKNFLMNIIEELHSQLYYHASSHISIHAGLKSQRGIGGNLSNPVSNVTFSPGGNYTTFIGSSGHTTSIPHFILEMKHNSKVPLVILGFLLYWLFCIMNSFFVASMKIIRDITSGNFQREIKDRFSSFMHTSSLKGLHFGGKHVQDSSVTSIEVLRFFFICTLRSIWITSMVLYMCLLPYQSLILLQIVQPFVSYITRKRFRQHSRNKKIKGMPHKLSAKSFSLDTTNYCCIIFVIVISIFLPGNSSSFLNLASYRSTFVHIIGVSALILSTVSKSLYKRSRESALRNRLRCKGRVHGNLDQSSYDDDVIKRSPSRSGKYEALLEFETLSGSAMILLLAPILLLKFIIIGPSALFSLTWEYLPLCIVCTFFFMTIPTLLSQISKQVKLSLVKNSSDIHFGHNPQEDYDIVKGTTLNDSESFENQYDTKGVKLYVMVILMLTVFQSIHFFSFISMLLLIFVYHRTVEPTLGDEVTTLPLTSDPNRSIIATYLKHFSMLSDVLLINKSSDLFRSIISDKETRNLLIFLLINVAFMFVELIYGVYIDSLGLISDAAHMFFDSTSLFIGLYGAVMSKWPRDSVYSYGYGRYEALSGFVNGLLLVFVSIFIFLMAIPRMFQPPIIDGSQLMTVSVLGFFVNLLGVIYFHNADPLHSNQNIHGVYLHMLADLLGSIGVIFSTFLIQRYGLHFADPICSIVISVIILSASIPLLATNGNCLLQGISEDLQKELNVLVDEIASLSSVAEIRSVHFWTMSDRNVIGSMVIQLKGNAGADAYQMIQKEAKRILQPVVQEISIGIEE